MLSDQKICPSCRTELNEEDDFCRFCGARLAETKRAASVCPSCGAEIEGDALFCTKCGAKREVKPGAEASASACTHCGAALFSDALFCTCCGKRIGKSKNADAAPPEKSAVSKDASSADRLPKTIVTRAAALLVSVLLFVFAFLPMAGFVSTNVSYNHQHLSFANDVTDVEIGYSVIDMIVFSVHALHDVDDYELLASYEDAMAEFNQAQFNIMYTSDERAAQRLYRALILDMVNYFAESESFNAKPIFLLTALGGIAYMVLSVLATVFSALAFVRVFLPGFGKKDRFADAVKLLGIAAPLALITGIGTMLSLHTVLSISAINLSSAEPPRILAAPILALVLVFLLAIALGVLRSLHDGKLRLHAPTVVRRFFSTACALLLLCSACFPVVGFEIVGNFEGDGREATLWLGAETFSRWSLSESERDVYENLHGRDKESLVDERVSGYLDFVMKNYTIDAVENGDAARYGHMIFSLLFLGYGGYRVADFYSMILPLFYLLLVLGAFLLQQNLTAIALGEDVAAIRVFCVVAVVCAALVLTMVAVVLLLTRLNTIGILWSETVVDFSPTMGAAPALALIGAIVCTAVPIQAKMPVRRSSRPSESTIALSD